MIIPKKLQTKYKNMIDTLRSIRMSEEEIMDKITELDTTEGYEPITLQELINYKKEDLSNLLSFCWKDGHYRCDCIGIENLEITDLKEGHYNISFSDENGNPNFEMFGLENPIYKIGEGGTWSYGLFKKKM